MFLMELNCDNLMALGIWDSMPLWLKEQINKKKDLNQDFGRGLLTLKKSFLGTGIPVFDRYEIGGDHLANMASDAQWLAWDIFAVRGAIMGVNK